MKCDGVMYKRSNTNMGWGSLDKMQIKLDSQASIIEGEEL